MVPEYEDCQDLSHSAWSLLSRGRRWEDGRPVLLKTAHGDSPSPAGVRRSNMHIQFYRDLIYRG